MQRENVTNHAIHEGEQTPAGTAANDAHEMMQPNTIAQATISNQKKFKTTKNVKTNWKCPCLHLLHQSVDVGSGVKLRLGHAAATEGTDQKKLA